MVKRFGKRQVDALREVVIEPDYITTPLSSALVRFGRTWVLSTVSVEEKVPPFIAANGKAGWITAEYNMLPGSSKNRIARSPSGRSKEIERLIGRSLRLAVDLSKLGGRTLTIDSEVLQADGGTRTAAITSGYVALEVALNRLAMAGVIEKDILRYQVAAVSIGIINGELYLDLDYEEDAIADVDLNVVMAKKAGEKSKLVEIQGTAEKQVFDKQQLVNMCELAEKGIEQLFYLQKEAIQKLKL